MDNNYPPYTFLDDNGNLQGILIDQWSLWEEKTGIQVEITGTNWADALERMEAGEFDVIDTLFYNESRALIYDFSEPYATIDVPIFFNNNISGIINAQSLKGFPVAVKSNDAVIDYLQNNGVNNLIEYESYEAIVAAAANHEVIVFAIDEPPGKYYLYLYGLEKNFNSTEPLYSGQFHRAVIKGNTELLATVENGFAQISTAEYDEIDQKWFGKSPVNKKYWLYIGIAGLAVLFTFLILVVKNRSLQLTVKRKTQNLQENEQQLRLIFENTGIGISIFDDTEAFLSCNAAIQQILGYTQEEFLKLSTKMITHPDDYEQYHELNAELWAGKIESFSLEKRNLHKDGHYVWGRVINSMIHDEQGKSLFIISMIEDITERIISENIQDAIYKIAQASNSSSSLNELFSLIHHTLGELMQVDNFYIALINPSDGMLHFPFFVDQYEDTPDPLPPGHGMTDYVLRLGRPLLATQDVLDQLIDMGEVELLGPKPIDWVGIPLLVNEKQIGVMAIQSYSQEVHYTNKDVELLAIISTQIAQAIERKRAEEALSASDADMRALFAAMTDIILVINSEGKYLKIVETNTELLYRPKNELIGKKLHEVMNKEDAEFFLRHITKALTLKRKVIFEYSLAVKEKIFWFSATLSPITEDSVIWVAHDISARKEAEEAQRISEARYRDLFEDSPISLWEEDFSVVNQYLGELRQKGITDFHQFFVKHPEEVVICASMIKLMDVNQEALKLVHAKSKRELIDNLEKVIGPVLNKNFISELVYIAEGKTDFELEGFNKTLDGKTIIINLRFSAALGYEDTLSKVIVSIIDITKSKQAEAALIASEERYRSLVDNLGEGIAIIEKSTQFLFANPSANMIFGMKPGELLKAKLYDFLSPDSHEFVRNEISRQLAGEVSTYELEIVRHDGEHRFLHVSARPQIDFNREYQGLFAIFYDITEEKEEEEKSKFHSRFEELLTNISTRFINVDNAEIDLEINKALQSIGEITAADRCKVFRIDSTEKLVTCTNEWNQTASPKQIYQTRRYNEFLWIDNRIETQPIIINSLADFPPEAAKEKQYFEEINVKSIALFPMWINQQLSGHVSFETTASERSWGQDCTTMMQQFTNILSNAIERSRLIMTLEDHAIRDDLTKVLNRRGFSEFAKMELNRAHRHNRPVGMILFDMDHLKHVNDTYGHAAGDEAIQKIIRCCLQNVREIDTIGRWGGDEFVILLPESSPESTVNIASRIQESIAELPFEINGNSVNLSISAGVAFDSNNCLTLDDLFRNADQALYQAKESGRNQIHFYTEMTEQGFHNF